MISVMVNVDDYGSLQVTAEESDTAGAVIQHIVDEYSLQFHGSTTLWDTSQSRVVQADENLVDGRLYKLSAWVVGMRVNPRTLAPRQR